MRPYIDAEGYWDGITAVWPDGHVSCLCSSVAKQMRRMVELGDLGEIMKRTWVCRNGLWHAQNYAESPEKPALRAVVEYVNAASIPGRAAAAQEVPLPSRTGWHRRAQGRAFDTPSKPRLRELPSLTSRSCVQESCATRPLCCSKSVLIFCRCISQMQPDSFRSGLNPDLNSATLTRVPSAGVRRPHRHRCDSSSTRMRPSRSLAFSPASNSAALWAASRATAPARCVCGIFSVEARGCRAG